MPEVGQEILRRIDFPEYPEDNPVFVVVVCNPRKETLMDKSGIGSLEPEDQDCAVLSRLIREWNFTKGGVPLEITGENVKLALTELDRGLIFQKLGFMGLISEVKKNR